MASKRKRQLQEVVARADAQWKQQQGPKPFVLNCLASLVVFNLYGQAALFGRADEALNYGERDQQPRNALQVGIELAQLTNDSDIFSMQKGAGQFPSATPVNNVCIIAGAILRRTYPHRYGLTATLSSVAA